MPTGWNPVSACWRMWASVRPAPGSTSAPIPAARHAGVAAIARARSTPRRSTSASAAAVRYPGSIRGGAMGSAETQTSRGRGSRDRWRRLRSRPPRPDAPEAPASGRGCARPESRGPGRAGRSPPRRRRSTRRVPAPSARSGSRRARAPPAPSGADPRTRTRPARGHGPAGCRRRPGDRRRRRCRVVRSASAGPTPDSISSCGERTTPAQRITSRAAWITRWPPEPATSTPVARPRSNTMRRTGDSSHAVGRPRSGPGRRYRALLVRRPRRCVTCR